MRFVRQLIFCGALISSLAGWSQDVKIVIPAGSPEDKELATITVESDAQKRISLYQEFLKTYEIGRAHV